MKLRCEELLGVPEELQSAVALRVPAAGAAGPPPLAATVSADADVRVEAWAGPLCLGAAEVPLEDPVAWVPLGDCGPRVQIRLDPGGGSLDPDGGPLDPDGGPLLS